MTKKREPRAQDLERLKKYPNWYIAPLSGRLVWRKHINGKPLTVRTGVVGKLNKKTGTVEGINAAREIVDVELEKIRTGKSEKEIKRERLGIINPLIDEDFQELCEIKLEGKAEGTKKNYYKLWKHGIEGYWGGKTRADIVTANIPKYKAWYLKESPKRLFEKTFDLLKMLFRFQESRKYIPEMPDLSELDDLDEIIKKNKKYKIAGRVYTQKEIDAMISAWPKFLGGNIGGTTSRQKKILAARARCGVTIGALCGMRVMEIMTLKKENIDFKKKCLNVWSMKNHKWREVPAVSEVIEAIKYQLEANAHLKSEWLFPMPSDSSRHISSQVFEKTWYKVRETAGVKPRHKYDARFHDLRKTFATKTAELGWPWKVACEILDMSGEMYEKTYANRITFEVKTSLMHQSFGGAK